LLPNGLAIRASESAANKEGQEVGEDRQIFDRRSNPNRFPEGEITKHSRSNRRQSDPPRRIIGKARAPA